MRNNTDNVAKYLAKGIASAIDADEYEYHELVRLAKLARASETELTVSIGTKTIPIPLRTWYAKAKASSAWTGAEAKTLCP